MDNFKKNIKLKNGNFIVLSLKKDDGYYKILATTNQDNTVAETTFKLNGKTCYLNRIEIKDTNFSHLGLGSQILKFMEEIALKARCNNVDGKFYPFGELGEFAKNFYLKNGYEIYKDGYETYISKYLAKETEKTF